MMHHLLLCLLSLSIAHSQSADSSSFFYTRPTFEGPVRGTDGQNNTMVWYQVPFGAQPERFEIPQKAPLRHSVYDATRQTVYGCPQIIEGLADDLFSEDCLQANIIAPKKFSLKLRPVIVNLVGGAFYYGTNALPDSLPFPLVEKADVVWVAPNFRVGVLGNLYLPDMNGGKGVNFQLQDIILALRWVKKNIVFFGGDPNNIILAGTSSGSFEASWFAGIPRTYNLVNKLFLDEGTLGSVLVTVDDNVTASTFGNEIAALLECFPVQSPFTSVLECLKSPEVTLDEINQVNYDFGIVGRSIAVYDGDLGVKVPLFTAGDLDTLLLSGQLKAIPAFTINLRDPGDIFAAEIAEELGTDSNYVQFIEEEFGVAAGAVLGFYPTLADLGDLISDSFWFCPGLIEAQYLPKTTQYVFWQHRPTFFSNPVPGVIHTSALPFFEGFPYDDFSVAFGQWGTVPVNEKVMSDHLIAQVKEFVNSKNVAYPWGAHSDYNQYDDTSDKPFYKKDFPLASYPTCQLWFGLWEAKADTIKSLEVNEDKMFFNNDYDYDDGVTANNNGNDVPVVGIAVAAGVVVVVVAMVVVVVLYIRRQQQGYQPL